LHRWQGAEAAAARALWSPDPDAKCIEWEEKVRAFKSEAMEPSCFNYM
jgi:hypothetical protein